MTMETRQWVVKVAALTLSIAVASLALASTFGGLRERVDRNTIALERKADDVLVRALFEQNKSDHAEIKQALNEMMRELRK